MATAWRTKRMTVAGFPKADRDEGRFELVRGEVITVPSPGPDHGRVVISAGFGLEAAGRTRGFGDCLTEAAFGTATGSDPVRGPDLNDRPSENAVVTRVGEFHENLPELPGFRRDVSAFFPLAPTQ